MLDLAKAKAESVRILEAVKTGDPDQTARNLRFLLDTNLITNKERREYLSSYLKNRPGGQGVTTQAPDPQGQSGSSSSTAGQDTRKAEPNVIVSFQSGWLGGGHNQSDVCNQGIASLQPKYPGKTLLLVSSDEISRKCFFGRAEYNYRCVFKVV